MHRPHYLGRVDLRATWVRKAWMPSNQPHPHLQIVTATTSASHFFINYEFWTSISDSDRNQASMAAPPTCVAGIHVCAFISCTSTSISCVGRLLLGAMVFSVLMWRLYLEMDFYKDGIWWIVYNKKKSSMQDECFFGNLMPNEVVVMKSFLNNSI